METVTQWLSIGTCCFWIPVTKHTVHTFAWKLTSWSQAETSFSFMACLSNFCQRCNYAMVWNVHFDVATMLKTSQCSFTVLSIDMNTF